MLATYIHTYERKTEAYLCYKLTNEGAKIPQVQMSCLFLSVCAKAKVHKQKQIMNKYTIITG